MILVQIRSEIETIRELLQIKSCGTIRDPGNQANAIRDALSEKLFPEKEKSLAAHVSSNSLLILSYNSPFLWNFVFLKMGFCLYSSFSTIISTKSFNCCCDQGDFFPALLLPFVDFFLSSSSDSSSTSPSSSSWLFQIF